MIIQTLAATVDQGIDAGIAEICFKFLKSRHDGLLNDRIDVKSLTIQVLLQLSEELEITGYQVGAVGSIVQYLPSKALHSHRIPEQVEDEFLLVTCPSDAKTG